MTSKANRNDSPSGRFAMSSGAWIAAIVLCIGLSSAPAWAVKPTIPFAEATVFFEFNSTDLDLGIQLFFDADGWSQVHVKGPGGKVFKVGNGGGLKRIGSTEVFTESAEPELCPDGEEGCDVDQAIADFLANFPEGTYVFTGKTVEGGKLLGQAELSWTLPAAVGIVDAEGNFPSVVWTPGAGGEPVVSYEVIVEAVAEVDDEELVFTQVTQIAADVTEVTTSPEFAAMVDALLMDGSLLELKVEIIAIGANGNKTITEEPIFEAEE